MNEQQYGGTSVFVVLELLWQTGKTWFIFSFDC